MNHDLPARLLVFAAVAPDGPGDGARPVSQSAALGAGRVRTAVVRRSCIGGGRAGPPVLQPDRARGRLRQGRCRSGRADAVGLRVCRNGYRDAPAAVGQSQAAAVPIGVGSRGDQSHGFQQWRAQRLSGQSENPHRTARHPWGQCRHQQGRRQPGARLSRADRRGRAALGLRDDQRIVPQHTGFARPANRGPAAVDTARRRPGAEQATDPRESGARSDR